MLYSLRIRFHSSDIFRYQQVILAISLAALVASAPTETKTVINVDGPDGQHVQTGEPGKAVSGYFT
jgi:hypothetical protein